MSRFTAIKTQLTIIIIHTILLNPSMQQPSLKKSGINPLFTFRSLFRPEYPNRFAHFTSLVLLLTLVSCLPADQHPPYPHADEPIGSAHQLYDGNLSHDLAVNTFRNTDRIFASRIIPGSANPIPLPSSNRALPEVQFTFQDTSFTLNDYIELNHVAAMLILKNGEIIHERYRFGNTDQTRWMSMSIAKSIVSTLIGAAIIDGYIDSIEDLVTHYVPSLEGTAYDGVTIRNVLMMTSGVSWSENYTNPTSDRRRLLDAQISQQPGAVLDVMKKLNREYPPGAFYRYNTGETQIAAEVLTRATGSTLSEYLSDRIWEPMGAESDAFWWLDSPNGVEIGGSGFSATLRDYGRFGQFVLNNGVTNGKSILPNTWIQEAGSPKSLPDGSEVNYGYLWWTAETTAGKRDGAFSADGIFGQTIYVNPAENVVIVVLSAWPHPTQSGTFDWDWSVFEAIVDSLR